MILTPTRDAIPMPGLKDFYYACKLSAVVYQHRQISVGPEYKISSNYICLFSNIDFGIFYIIFSLDLLVNSLTVIHQSDLIKIRELERREFEVTGYWDEYFQNVLIL